jgi:uncharacterized protein involved in response to NO
MEKGKYCVHCGAQIDSLAEICPGCGVRQPSLKRPGRISRRVAAAIGWGILYVLFCWTFIPALAGIIEGIIYLTKSDEEFDAKYLR